MLEVVYLQTFQSLFGVGISVCKKVTNIPVFANYRFQRQLYGITTQVIGSI